MSDTPVVLFACIHNSGRSVAARVLSEHYAQGAIEARFGGLGAEGPVNPVVAEVLADRACRATPRPRPRSTRMWSKRPTSSS
jgi:arsenate reductase